MLDGFLILAQAGSSSPDDVVTVNLSSLGVVDVAADDLAFFKNLDRIDVSDNQLSFERVLEEFGRVPRLGSLSLACNTISQLSLQQGTLRQLHRLDLSFNELHGDVLAQLAGLPSLTFLNLCSNCVSSVPPEEDLTREDYSGFRCLEELILDDNDLVQFIQWRALDALPRLRKLSLASNRVKRLKDDVPDKPEGDFTYFPVLEELNLASNEIGSLDSLPALELFQALRVLCVDENPCAKGPIVLPPSLRGLTVKSHASAPWYLQRVNPVAKTGKAKSKGPKDTLSRHSLKTVRDTDLKLAARQRGAGQIAVLDAGANELIMTGLTNGFSDGKRMLGSMGTTAHEPALMLACPPASEGIFSEDLSDEELDRIFRERRENIDRKFREPDPEVESFMKPLPFVAISAAGQKLGFGPPQEEQPALAGGGMPNRPSSSSFFLTGVGEEAGDATRPGGRARPPQQPSPAPSPSPLTPATPLGVTLPPIEAGSRGSSAGGAGVEGGYRKPNVVDAGVREAIRALRAASMSEYAVAV